MYKIYWQKVYIDELSSISKRRAFNEYLGKLGRKYTIAMVDIDYFKKFNDRYGHEEGDNVLRFVANHLREESAAVVFRYGGEEFSLIYRGLNITDVFWRVDRMREKLAKKSFHIRVPLKIRQYDSAEDRGKKIRNNKKVRVNISIGLAQRTSKLKTTRDVINAADKALYRAKSNGRNQCLKARI
jgi:diguanylate cyclase (GGDEF)-like protein